MGTTGEKIKKQELAAFKKSHVYTEFISLCERQAKPEIIVELMYGYLKKQVQVFHASPAQSTDSKRVNPMETSNRAAQRRAALQKLTKSALIEKLIECHKSEHLALRRFRGLRRMYLRARQQQGRSVFSTVRSFFKKLCLKSRWLLDKFLWKLNR